MATTLQKRIEWLAKEVAFGAIDLLEGVYGIILQLILKFYILGFLLALGLALVTLRQFFLWLCPVLVNISHVVTFFLNVILLFLDVFIDALILVLKVIFDIISVLSSKGNADSLIKWVHYHPLSAAKLRQVLTSIPATCRKYDGAGIIIQFLVRYNVHEYTCPAVRYLYPMQWLYTVNEFILGWTYYGSAKPFTDISDENCLKTGNQREDYVCAGLGIGFIILEVLLPVLLIYIVWTQVGPGIKKILWAGFVWIFYLIEYSVDIIVFVIKAIES